MKTIVLFEKNDVVMYIGEDTISGNFKIQKGCIGIVESNLFESDKSDNVLPLVIFAGMRICMPMATDSTKLKYVGRIIDEEL